MTGIGIVIMAHPDREEWAYELADTLQCPIVFDENPEPTADPERRWKVGAQAWEVAAIYGKEWSMVLQDDARVCRDLEQGLGVALEPFHGQGLISAYLGKPRHSTEAASIWNSKVEGSTWVSTPGLNWGVAVAAPTNTVDTMLDWCSRPERAGDNYDFRIGKFYRDVVGWRTFYTRPSLVDHRDEGSLVGHGKGQVPRVAHEFIGEDASALDVKWSPQPPVSLDLDVRPNYAVPYRRRLGR